MSDRGTIDACDLAAAVSRDGYVYLTTAEMGKLLDTPALASFDEFAASWERLQLDTYMADGGRYRKRRHARFRSNGKELIRLPHAPHWQARDHNPLNGGVERWFEPVEDAVASSPMLAALVRISRGVFTLPDTEYLVELHQFRIEARAGASGQPTPEGMHRDGVDHVLIMLIGRRNVSAGVTAIEVDGCRTEFTLTAPLETVLLDDLRVYHGVTPITPLDPTQAGWRDVLVLTLKREKNGRS